MTLPGPAEGAPTWVRSDFAKPQTMSALTYVGPLGGRFAEGPQGRIEASDDGSTWRSLRTLGGGAHNPAPQRTFAFPATTARHFRIVFDRAVQSRAPWPTPPGIPIAELAPVPGSRIDLFEDCAGFGVHPQADALQTPAVAARAAITSAQVIDLTDRLRPDGTLDWTSPAGDWIVLRTGWSLTGVLNHPATPEGTGLEVEKFNAAHVRAHLDAYMTPVIRELGALAGKKGLTYLLTDSWEAGQENWTEPMPAEFRKRRAYDLTRMLPALAGYVVDSAARSDAFLWDFRRTLADLIAENHYGTITRFAKEHGLGYYGEATGAGWPQSQRLWPVRAPPSRHAGQRIQTDPLKFRPCRARGQAQRLGVMAVLFLDLLPSLPEEQVGTDGCAQDGDEGGRIGGVELQFRHDQRSESMPATFG